jgi:ATP-binding cassette subfamily F protein uup
MNLSFGQKVIFDEAKITINKGDRIGLIGLNGHGKSTLFNIFAGTVIPDISTPAFIFDRNKDLFKLFYVPQELDIDSFPELDLPNFWLSFYPEIYQLHKQLKVLEEKLAIDYSDEKLLNKQQNIMDKYESLGAWDIENQYLNYLNNFDLADKMDTPVKLLSGGEQRKMALSIGLSTKAEFVLWDEPTNHLDVESIEKFEDELTACGKTFMVISHDRYLLNNVCQRIVQIERGDINTFTGSYMEYIEYLDEKEMELAKNLDKLQNKHRRELAWMRQGIKARGTRSKKRVEGYNNIKDDIRSLKERAKKVVDLSLNHSGRKSKQLVEITDGSFGYTDNLLLKNLNLRITKNQKIALIGPNGAGKSTLLKLLLGDLQLSTGTHAALDDFKVVIFDQKRDSLDESMTPFDLIGEGQDFVHLSNGSTKHVSAYLEDFLFDRDQISRPISTLSGGERNRLQLAKFMRLNADLWIFDEPTNDLDIETIELLERELREYKAGVIIVGHDRAFLDNTCNTTWLVHNKEIEIFEGGYSQVAPYLQALQLESQLPANKKEAASAKKVDEAKSTPSTKTKMSYKEKERFKVIEKEINTTETKVDELKAKLAAFDFSKPSDDTTKKYDSMNSDFTKAEKKLESLYAEWEDLEGKEV